MSSFYIAPCMLFFLLFEGNELHSSPVNSPLPLPQGIILPWNFQHVDSGLIRKFRPSFTKATQRLSSLLLKNGSLFQRENLPLNLKKRMKEVIVGDLQSLSSAEPLAFQPVICSLGKNNLAFLSAIHTKQNIFWGITHILLEKNFWADASWEETLPDLLAESLNKTLASPPAQDNALQIAFSEGAPTTRYDETSSLCLNLLLSEQLVHKGNKVIPFIGNDMILSVRRAFALKESNARSTFQLTTFWEFPSHREDVDFPLTLKLRYNLAAAVFSDEIFKNKKSVWTFEKDPTQKYVSFVFDPELESFFTDEKLKLKFASLPRVIDQNGAWAYLDLGRGWGLEMEDRLVSKDITNEIKGHVVGFFGPELKLKNAEGKPIYEGAIVYIRKGQRFVSKGLTFDFDPTLFPTPWPPAAPASSP